MGYHDIYNVVQKMVNDKIIKTSIVALTVLTLILGIFVSPLLGLVIYISYILGYIVCWYWIKYQDKTTLFLHGIINFCSSSSRKKIKHSCSICDDSTCQRHHLRLSVNPSRNLLISKELNQAIKHFYNKILDTFISSWYGQFTEDVDFLNELRCILRYVSASVIRRFLDVNHSEIITKKLLPLVIKHLDEFFNMLQIVKVKNTDIDKVMVEYLAGKMHVAVTNRKNEHEYLQQLIGRILRGILPEHSVKCRNYSILIREILTSWVFLPLMDLIADPNVINYLIIIGRNYQPKLKKHSKGEEMVEFLSDFMDGNLKKSSLSVDLMTIKENTDLLYGFMQFLKRENAVQFLQFCLDVDDFNSKLLTPDLGDKELAELQSNAVILFKEYLDENSLNAIGCPPAIVKDFDRLIHDGSVVKFRTSKPLYQAYEYAFSVLENVWLPLFFHSNEFYQYVCGTKITATYNKNIISRGRKYEMPNSSPGTVSKISSGLDKIKGALKTSQPIEGTVVYPMENQSSEILENIITDCGSIFRDLNAWRISILSYQTINKVVSFCINVQRLDAVDDSTKRHWIVMRKDQDFYTLKAKLVEFHGENEICDSPLPFRKADSSLEIRMAKYEDFLKKLLQKSSLRGSDLLHTFLTSEEDFTLATSSVQSTQDIGNIYQSVAHKLRKEKGQHLDTFMATFLQSIEKNRPSKFEWPEVGDEVDVVNFLPKSEAVVPKTYHNHIFNDNLGIVFKIRKGLVSSSSSFNPSGIVQCLFYLLKYVFRVPYFLLKLYAAICSVAGDVVESFLALLIEKKLKAALSSINCVYILGLLEDVLFKPHVPPTNEELNERKLKAFSELEHIFPTYFGKSISTSFGDGLKAVLNILQHPHYNKQLAYNLLDVIILELYPDLSEDF